MDFYQCEISMSHKECLVGKTVYLNPHKLLDVWVARRGFVHLVCWTGRKRTSNADLSLCSLPLTEEEQNHNNSIYDNDKELHIYIVLIYIIRTSNKYKGKV